MQAATHDTQRAGSVRLVRQLVLIGVRLNLATKTRTGM